MMAASMTAALRVLLVASVAWLAGFGWFEHQARHKRGQCHRLEPAHHMTRENFCGTGASRK